MKFQLEVGDRLRTIEIERRADGFLVSVDGRTHVVDAAHVGSSEWSLLVGDASNGDARRSVNATVVPERGGSGFTVHIDGFQIPVALRTGRGRRAGDGQPAAGGRGGVQRVAAPMPGRVVRVLVAAGETVAHGQGLVVVEAMKMENELRAARDGVVREVLVAEGQSVEAGAILVVVE